MNLMHKQNTLGKLNAGFLSLYHTLQRRASSSNSYDVIVVGGGHAGCEAAHASARIGCSTLLLTHKISTIGEMSCNPSFGGIGKGHLVKEVDALDGVCGRVCDKSGIHFRILNKTKGPAVWGPRAQIDRNMYRSNMQQVILNTENLTVMEGSVDDLIIEEPKAQDSSVNEHTKARCTGVILGNSEKILSKCVVLTAGTFLRGQINIGLERIPAGRKDDSPAIKLAETIEKLGFTMGRLKTGTPPRLLANSINFDNFTAWKPDKISHPFSFMSDRVWIPSEQQLNCYTTHTSEKVRSIVLDTLPLNSHVNEEINGPRYCPSLESKILKFSATSHIVWFEPEELNTKIIYLQGFSCTMPEEYQLKAVRTLDGCKEAIITQPGYGVEYDYMDPRQLFPTLETKRVQDLFFAGQINGTTGYEEAAAQGIVAGINAALKSQRKKLFTLGRSDGYIGVLIDDLTSVGTNEPYRMFTSRAEFRMTLRPDNADERLTMKGYEEAGCVSDKRMEKTVKTLHLVKQSVSLLKSIKKTPEEWIKLLPENNKLLRVQKLSAFQLLSNYHEINSYDICKLYPDELQPMLENVFLRERITALSLYDSLSHRQEHDIRELKKEENLLIPDSIDYSRLVLKSEICEKLAQLRPMNLAAASRIQGITPTALLCLVKHVKKLNR